MGDEILDEFVRVFQLGGARRATTGEADAFLVALRVGLGERINALHRAGDRPEFVHAFLRLLGRLYDATETGGTRG